MKKIAVLFGGVSAEHDVSVISGLQVMENMDRELFLPLAIKLTKEGLFEYYGGLGKREDYLKVRPVRVMFGRDDKGAFFQDLGFFGSKTYIDGTYLAFHGGNGESGQMQGLMDVLGIPYTCPSVESSAVAMNKVITKEILSSRSLPTVPGESFFDYQIKENVDNLVDNLKVKLPVIVKPAHLGSSIGINIAKTKIELKKYLLEASQMDREILVEKLITDFVEYNVSVRKIGDRVETSEIEKPLSEDEILSFADKYERGGKKSGGGMESLNRELPAKISKDLETKLKAYAIKTFEAIRAKGLVRIDFMVSGKDIFITEVNPIPGSMSFYLWEASGITFTDQITQLINQAMEDQKEQSSKHLEYKSDIVEKFIHSRDR